MPEKQVGSNTDHRREKAEMAAVKLLFKKPHSLAHREALKIRGQTCSAV